MKWLPLCLAASLSVMTTAVYAEKHDHDHKHEEEKREYGKHVHGEAQVTAALQGQQLEMRLRTPLANIRSVEEDKREAALKESFSVAGADCKLSSFNIDVLEVEHKDHDEHEHEEKSDHDHDEHKHEEKAEHGHDEHRHEEKSEHDHDEHKHEEKAEHDHDKHEKAKEKVMHKDFEVSYQFNCGSVSDAVVVKSHLFERFEGFEKIDVQWLSDKGQGAVTLTADEPTIKMNE